MVGIGFETAPALLAAVQYLAMLGASCGAPPGARAGDGVTGGGAVCTTCGELAGAAATPSTTTATATATGVPNNASQTARLGDNLFPLTAKPPWNNSSLSPTPIRRRRPFRQRP